MPTPSSGAISFQNLLTTFGSASMADLYKGGANVPNITPNSDIPTSGEINMQEMYSAWGRKTTIFTITVGSHATGKGKKGTLYGYGLLNKGGSFGSISNSTILTPNGVMTIQGLYYSTANSKWHLQLASTSAPADNDLSFRSVSAGGYSIGGARSNRTSTYTIGNARQWTWYTTNTSHPTSGSVVCSIQYYG